MFFIIIFIIKLFLIHYFYISFLHLSSNFLCSKFIHGLLSILFYEFHMLSEVRPLHLHISSIINKGFQYYVTKKKSQYDLLRKVMFLFLKILNNIIQLLDNCPNFLSTLPILLRVAAIELLLFLKSFLLICKHSI
jgi:hypothetical protein